MAGWAGRGGGPPRPPAAEPAAAGVEEAGGFGGAAGHTDHQHTGAQPQTFFQSIEKSYFQKKLILSTMDFDDDEEEEIPFYLRVAKKAGIMPRSTFYDSGTKTGFGLGAAQ